LIKTQFYSRDSKLGAMKKKLESLSLKEGPHEMIYDFNIFKGFSWKTITQI